MCKTLDVTRQTCGRYVVETCLRPDGAVFLRTPEIGFSRTFRDDVF